MFDMPEMRSFSAFRRICGYHGRRTFMEESRVNCISIVCPAMDIRRFLLSAGDLFTGLQAGCATRAAAGQAGGFHAGTAAGGVGAAQDSAGIVS